MLTSMSGHSHLAVQRILWTIRQDLALVPPGSHGHLILLCPDSHSRQPLNFYRYIHRLRPTRGRGEGHLGAGWISGTTGSTRHRPPCDLRNDAVLRGVSEGRQVR
jgi:hypothetical protein